MQRKSTTLTIETLRSKFLDIEFPEYQREPDIWSRVQKQRLIDSILRRFDIASVYFYKREDGTLECIDGRQRLNAIMSFLKENPRDIRDNGFALSIENEISQGLTTDFDCLDGKTFEQIKLLAENNSSEMQQLAKDVHDTILTYAITTVRLSEVRDNEEFNLQFLRLNLGTLINAGEKLHAMVGAMRDVIFADNGIGKHPFFDCVRIPTRRYARELTAAQVLLQMFSIYENREFSRARHVELQRFLKQYEELDPNHPLIDDARDTLNVMSKGSEGAANYLRNRAVTVSLILLAWQRNVASQDLNIETFWGFVIAFMDRLRAQVDRMKSFNVDRKYLHLVEFQRHLTQAAVERPAINRRQEILSASLDQWLKDGTLEGDQ